MSLLEPPDTNVVIAGTFLELNIEKRILHSACFFRDASLSLREGLRVHCEIDRSTIGGSTRKIRGPRLLNCLAVETYVD